MITNAQLWDYLRGKYPNFKNNTSKGTSDLFTDRGFEQLQATDPSILNDFFGLSIRVFLQKIDVANVKDILEGQGFGESYDTPYGGFVQRMSIDSVKPVSPAYKGLNNGDSPDQFVVRKPVVGERFYKQNFDYQSLITVPDATLYKDIWTAKSGMSEYVAGIMKALQNGYTLQKYNNKLEALNAGINSATNPLKTTQKFETATVADATTAIAFVKLVRDIADSMVYTPATGAYNVAGFETTQDIKRLKLLARPTLFTQIATISRLNSPEDMALPIDIVKVPDFGGLVPYTDSTMATAVTPVYGALGEVTGYKDASDNTYSADELYWADPNSEIMAIIADKGYIFENIQNPYIVEPARNARGLYTNYWASSPNNGIVVDNYKNIVTISAS